MNTSIINQTNIIHLILGPMFAGKTTELMRIVNTFKLAECKCIVISYKNGKSYNDINKDKLYDGKYVIYDDKIGDLFKCYDILSNTNSMMYKAKYDILEIENMRKLYHRNILSIYDHYILDNIIITEIVTDILRLYIKNNKFCIISLSYQILKGLEFLQYKNSSIMYKYLDCNNIFINIISDKIVVKIGLPINISPYCIYNYNETYLFGLCLLEMETLELPCLENKKNINNKIILNLIDDCINGSTINNILCYELYMKNFEICFNDRYVNNSIKTHLDEYYISDDYIKIVSTDMLNKIIIPKDIKLIAIDEGQFFIDIDEMCNKWLNEYKCYIVVSALDGSCRRKIFEPISKLIPYCSIIYKQQAICMICKNKSAPYSYRITDENDLIVLGSIDKYKSLCRLCLIEKEISDNINTLYIK